ncbi:chloramphenicol-sensitive protein RarD [Octadecabacter temperatus]|uniref:EamA-like transporter family protein n=1 Tax=Octadecabacter temperatus TaxID=1458307 RepID=A0A0K0Y9E9_9RHOB|nr:EamA family transporter RarD [Octadecabacter temperatus]AKS47540.1 EamA-like transporter family protein [Octadecabacter temperatus]SIO41518.1 chloramphenicol-sensitive protein RarD [Octadecabacter temperatus]
MAKPSQNEDTLRGFGFAFSAYLLWGFLPLYMKWLAHVPAVEVVAHRILWSVPVAGLVLFLLGRTSDIGRILKDPRSLAMGCLTAALVSVNWGVYVWAISVDRTLDAALGYYINPLFSVFLGSVLLGERLKRLQWVAVAIATSAVAVLAYENGSLPWPALALTTTWGFYAYFKRSLPIGPNQGFLLEVLILTPFAVGYLIWLWINGGGHFVPVSVDMWLLMGCGIVTAVPLMLYANGAKGLRLTTIGIMQYIAPTMIMLVALFVFKEPFGHARAIAFPMIWAALGLYTYSMFRSRK